MELLQDAAQFVGLGLVVGALPCLMDWGERKATRPVSQLRREASRPRRTSAFRQR